MSSIRLFVLGSLTERGAMHGHALHLLAEEEHIDLWADVAASAIYGVLKRLLAEGLTEVVRTERQGNYPERQVYDVTASGQRSLDDLRRDALEQFSMKPDPIDLALARLDPDKLNELTSVIAGRLSRLSARREKDVEHLDEIAHYLTLAERQVMRHTTARLTAEIAWHEELLQALPEIIADEKLRQSTKGHH